MPRTIPIATIEQIVASCGTGTPVVMPFADTGAMNAHLAEIAGAVAPGAHAVLVLDDAGWHGGGGLVVPANISLVLLPP